MGYDNWCDRCYVLVEQRKLLILINVMDVSKTQMIICHHQNLNPEICTVI